MEDIKRPKWMFMRLKKKKHYLKLKNTLDVIKNRSYKFEEKISEPKT